MAHWYIGATINVIGSIMINLGTNLMKLGHNTRLDLPVSDRPPVRRFKSWQIGVGLFGVGNVANFISFGFAAQSLLAALGSIQFVSNVVFAWLVLQEKVTKKIVAATVLIISGCIILVVYGNHESPILTSHELLDLYTRPAYVYYLCFLAVTVVVMYGVYQYGRIIFEAQGIAFQHLTGKWAGLLPISYAAYSGVIGTQSVLYGKTLSLLIRATVRGDQPLLHWFTFVALGLFVVSATFWVTRLNKALRLFPALVIVPTMQISWTLFSILTGTVYFEEYKVLSPFGAVMCCGGVVVIFSGVYLLTRTRKLKRKPMDIQLNDETHALLGERQLHPVKSVEAKVLRQLTLWPRDKNIGISNLRTLLATATTSCSQNATWTPLAAYPTGDAERSDDQSSGSGDDLGDLDLELISLPGSGRTSRHETPTLGGLATPSEILSSPRAHVMSVGQDHSPPLDARRRTV